METIVGGNSSEALSSSSTHAVVLNDDLLIEILFRLPIFSLHLFKSVSKRWLTLITDPNFTRRTQNLTLNAPSGLFLLRHTSLIKYDFLSFNSKILANPTSPLRMNSARDFNSSDIKIIQSCNGLLLCTLYKTNKPLYVYNPFTNRFKMILDYPYLQWRRKFGGFRMAFDPSKSPHYKIFYATSMNIHYYRSELWMYSSETCNWSVCLGFFYSECFKRFYDGVYCNNAIHWLKHVEGGYVCKLDVEDSSVTCIQTPTTSSDGTLHCYRKLFESRGCLLLLCTKDDHSMHMDIFEMRKGCFGWSVKYIVNLDDFMIRFPKKTPKWFCSSVGCIVVGNDEEDSFLVMEIYGKIVRYKLASKTIICDQLNEFEYSFYQRCFQFIPSNADV